MRDCTICIAQIKALISFAVTAKLVCTFVFVYANCLFSHAAAQSCLVDASVITQKTRLQVIFTNNVDWTAV